MGGTLFDRDARRGLRTVAVVVASLSLAACSSSNTESAPSIGDWFKGATTGSTSAPLTQTAAAESSTVAFCPPIDIRSGAASISLQAPPARGADPSTAMALRYQVSMGQTARECASAGGNLTIRVGVQGRVILGPAGGAGSIEVPIRYALVQEGTTPKTLWTKLDMVTVTIPEGAPHTTFTHIVNDLSVPRPGGNDIESYVIYVGFDPMTPKEKPAKKRPPQRRQNQPSG